MRAHRRIVLATLLLSGAAIGLARMSSAGGAPPTVELIHRAKLDCLELPLDWVSLIGFAATGGTAAINGNGHLVLPMVRVSDDIWGLSQPDLEVALAGLPKPNGSILTSLPDEGLLLRWEPVVEVLEPVNAAFLGITGSGGTRVTSKEIGWGPNATGKERDQFPPQELRRCVTAWSESKAFHEQSRQIAAPGFVSASPSTMTFSFSGSLKQGCSTRKGFLNVGRGAGGVIWLWFSST